MRVPLEILEIILREAVETLSYRDILRFRLVNRTFNEALWPKNAHLDNKRTLFTSWRTFPYKQKYIWYLIEEHKKRPSFFSSLIERILDLPHIALMSDEEQHIIIDKMVGAVMGSRDDPEVLFGLRSDRDYARKLRRTYTSNERLESAKDALAAGLAVSAIRRGDHEELQAMFDQGARSKIFNWNYTLGMVPIDMAYKVGTREVIRTLVKNGCPNRYETCSSWCHDSTCGLAVAARHGNQEVLETWITLLSERANQLGKNLFSELRAAVLGVLRIGKTEMVPILEKYMNWSQSDMDLLWVFCFNDAVRNGMLEVVQWLLRREGSSVATRTSPRHKTPLSIALHDCPSEKRLAMIQLLLDNGVDPNGDPGASQTPIQRAIGDGEVEAAMLLLKGGANPNAVGRRGPPLRTATRLGNTRLVKCLLEHGARSSYQFKGMKYVVRQDARVLGNIERLLEELGMTEEDPAATQELGYFVLAQKCNVQYR
ncbi:uncharacterized protein N7498_007802 [Penicillium cinerascens]|uniref:F-box domain-containing protein n=1 Tax=Penicillium cinerascens TaxID=70096 RepID=A0A9W9MDP9_9EURO|nr:uncharacterized protein N7498_007802 [Penicillium cinerascens]KAJ5198685.1 hypothetical protein N7498_007802 [Penicillium cinerascens]